MELETESTKLLNNRCAGQAGSRRFRIRRVAVLASVLAPIIDDRGAPAAEGCKRQQSVMEDQDPSFYCPTKGRRTPWSVVVWRWRLGRELQSHSDSQKLVVAVADEVTT